MTVVIGRFGALIRLGLLALLTPATGLEVVGLDRLTDDLEGALVRHRPHVLLVDADAVRDDRLLMRSREISPSTSIVVIMPQLTRARALSLLARGASACLDQDSSGLEILNAITLAIEGTQVIVARPVVHTASPQLVAPATLTQRETEIRDQLSLGRSNAQIALALNISVETVRTHAGHIYRKLGINNRTELIGLGTFAGSSA
jgi:DNA-binding NarL/FixJ family response regulator